MEHIRIHTRDAGALFLAVLLWQGISVSVRGTRLSPKHGNSDLKLVFSGNDCGKTKGCYFYPESCSSSPNNCNYFVSYTMKGSWVTFELSGKTKWIAVGFNYKAQMFSGNDCGKTKGCYFYPESCSSSPNNCNYFVSYTMKGSWVTFELSGKTKWIAVGFNYKAQMDGTDSIICSALPNGSTLIGHYPVTGHKRPKRTKQVIKELKFEGISHEGGVVKCKFSRQKSSSMMAVDLNEDLYVIFASGPVGDDGSLVEHKWFKHSMSPVNLAEIGILEVSSYDLLIIQLHGKFEPERFSRQKSSSMMAVDLNKDLYVILASGPVGDDGSLVEHKWFKHSMSPVNLAEIGILEVSSYDLLIIQLHAILMVLAWVGFATLGMFIARYMRPVWGEKEIFGKRIWFVVHTTIMLFTAMLTIFGAALAFLYVGSWSEVRVWNEKLALNQSSFAHCHCAAVLSVSHIPNLCPFRRVLFNWAHRGVGLMALALAVVNIFLGCVLPAFLLENSAVYVMIVYLLALASVCGFEFYLTLCTKIDADNYKVLSRPDSDEVEVAVTSRRQNSGDVRKKLRLHNVVFGVLILVLGVVCLAMLVLLTVHEEADNEDDDD
ncbi:PREDICTED: putative ferric-chelate reductase 1 [Acropora digitifera]|uniref:putative ferric-chelate reductase 1 n=1 Tax=Acropora digitifera TaxID=70779 RepID=UPI00077A96BF|nr:PREDICTED: putative ferric-chelate reductase 1 [Acropora digitifera]